LQIIFPNSLRWFKRQPAIDALRHPTQIPAGRKFLLCEMLSFNLLKQRTLAQILARNSNPSREFEKTPGVGWGEEDSSEKPNHVADMSSSQRWRV